MKTTIQATILASMMSAGMAMPAMAIPEGPPSFVLGTEQAYTMTPLSAYLGATPSGLMLRNGMPGNWEWWLQNTNLNITPGFTVGTDLGAKVMFLNNANKVLRYRCISSGGMTSTVVDPKIIFREALDANATKLLLCHNHPSGSLRPSHADIRITHKIKELGLLFDITVLDHIIVSETGYYSLVEEGII